MKSLILALTVAHLSASLAAIQSVSAPLHSADVNSNSRLELTELLRVIELYNTHNGTVRTGAYVPDDTNLEDGFNVDPARAPDVIATLTRYHSADSNQDGKINLTELLRVIELYNYRSGTVRTGEYHAQAGTEDGFAPGPAAPPAPMLASVLQVDRPERPAVPRPRFAL